MKFKDSTVAVATVGFQLRRCCRVSSAVVTVHRTRLTDKLECFEKIDTMMVIGTRKEAARNFPRFESQAQVELPRESVYTPNSKGEDAFCPEPVIASYIGIKKCAVNDAVQLCTAGPVVAQIWGQVQQGQGN
jgi:hypothetical protein